MKRLSFGFAVGLVTGAALAYVLLAHAPDPDKPIVADALSPDSIRPLPLNPGAISAPDLSPAVSAIQAMAATDPLGALEQILELDDGRELSRAIAAVAPVWVTGDPATVLDEILTIEVARVIGSQPVRDQLFDTVLRYWSVNASAAAFRYLTAVDEQVLPATIARYPGSFASSLPLDPDADLGELFSLADGLPTPYARTTRQQIVRTMADRDPVMAAEYLTRMPYVDRLSVTALIASNFVARDTDAALEWARTAGNPQVLEAVLSALALQQPLRAIAISFEAGGGTAGIGNTVSAAMRSVAVRPEEIAATLLQLPPSAKQEQAFDAMVRAWNQQNPQAMIAWLFAQTDSVPVYVYDLVARGFINDPELGASFTDRVPIEARPDWMNTIAQAYVRTDPRGAALWIEAYRGEPGFNSAVARIGQHLAGSDGMAAARLIGNTGTQNDNSAVLSVAIAWAGHDPAAAAEWVQSLPDGRARLVALQGVARQWLQYDRDGARTWTLSLPRDEDRDAVLSTMLGSVRLIAEVPDDDVLSAFSSDEAAEETILIMSMRLGRDEPDGARRLIERNVSDQSRRQRFEQSLGTPGSTTRFCGAFRPVPC